MVYLHVPALDAGAQYADDFNRADGAIGGGWVGGTSAWLIAANATRSGTAFSAYIVWPEPCATQDQFSQARILNGGTSGYHGLMVRANLAATTGVIGWCRTNGDWALGSTSLGFVRSGTIAAPGASAIVRLEASGSTARLYVNGSLVDSITVSESGAHVGMAGSNTNGPGGAMLDDWKGGDL
ncbi:hypothetical protein ACFWQG_12975 [Rhodococcus sp. NPDC058532]|uniref:hypothetical protein n=1 Tax=Rhodococcus sp. NPDC058532 TaxID=3346540 RepID=UPI003655A3A2